MGFRRRAAWAKTGRAGVEGARLVRPCASVDEKGLSSDGRSEMMIPGLLLSMRDKGAGRVWEDLHTPNLGNGVSDGGPGGRPGLTEDVILFRMGWEHPLWRQAWFYISFLTLGRILNLSEP